MAELSGERPRELGPWKSVGVEEEHEIAASGAQPLVVVHDDDLGEVRIAGERGEAPGEAPFFISSRYDRADHHAASARGA